MRIGANPRLLLLAAAWQLAAIFGRGAESVPPVGAGIAFQTGSPGVTANSLVLFTLKVEGTYKGLPGQVHFGDGQVEPWHGALLIPHVYSQPTHAGEKLLAYAALGVSEGSRFVPRVRSAYVEIEVAAPAPATLTVTAKPNPVRAGDPVNFSVKTSGVVPKNPTFLFDPGDNSGGEQFPGTQFTHTYAGSGSFTARVTIAGTKVGGEATIEVSAPLHVSLSVAPKRLPVGRKFQFTAEPGSLEPGLLYRFNFSADPGDEAVTPDAAVQHAYPAAGSFRPFVEIGRLVQTKKNTPGTFTVLAASPAEDITVAENPRIQLTPHQAQTRIGQSVWFTVSMSDGSIPAEFHYTTGDDPRELPGRGPRFVHTYRRAGTFAARISAGESTDTATVSVRPSTLVETVEDTWKVSPFWTRCLIGLAALAGLGWSLSRAFFPRRLPAPPRPLPAVTLVARLDPHPRWRPVRRAPDIGYSLRLQRRFDQGRYHLAGAAAGLIHQENKTHD